MSQIDDFKDVELDAASPMEGDEITLNGGQLVSGLNAGNMPKTHIVNNSNVGEIFSGENDTLGDDIAQGDTLDIQGTIDKNRYLVINKSVNIISTNKDAVINLHTVIGGSVNNIPKFSFVITAGAAGSNIILLLDDFSSTFFFFKFGIT